MKCSPSITMRATHRKMISPPVIIVCEGYQQLSSSVVSGQPRIEKGQMPLENQVSSVSGSRVSSSRAVALLRRCSRFFFRFGDDLVSIGRVPDGKLMPPPDLARDVPVADVFEPVLVDAAVAFGDEANAAVAIGFQRRLRQRLHLDEPLQREQRLDDVAAAIAGCDRMAMRPALRPGGPRFCRSATMRSRASKRSSPS